MKTCSKCGALKKDSEFSTRSDSDKLVGRCKQCVAASSRNWYSSNADRACKAAKDRRLRNPEASRITHRAWLLRNPGYAKKQYQKNSEALCKAVRERRKKDPEKFRKYARERRLKNIVRVRQQAKERYRRNRSSYRVLALKKHYGITLEEYTRLKIKQSGTCAICNEAPKETLAVDHDHKTGRVRGLLCRKCNTGLGNFRDRLEFLASAMRYLRGGS